MTFSRMIFSCMMSSLVKLSVQMDEQGVDVDVHNEFASDDASLEVDALDVVTHDVTMNSRDVLA